MGSPTVRMIVTRSSASVDGWGILSRYLDFAVTEPMIEPPSEIPRLWKFGRRRRMTPPPRPAPASAPKPLSPRLAFVLVAGIVGLALFASGTPSPLYGTYRELWGFSP